MDLQAAALVFAVGEDDHRFAPDLVLQLLVRAQIDCVVEQGASRRGGNRPAAQSRRSTAHAGIDLHLVQGAGQVTHIVGEVLIEVHIHIKVDDEGKVLLTQHAAQKLGARLLLDGQHARLAGAGVDHDAQGQRLVRFRRKILDGLRLAVLEHLEVVFGEVGNQHAVLVLHIEEQVDDVDLRLEGLQRFFIGRRLRLLVLGWEWRCEGGSGIVRLRANTLRTTEAGRAQCGDSGELD